MPSSWKKQGDSLVKEFVFEDFVRALYFVNKVGDLAEEHNHHPDIKMFDYKKVEIRLTTHSKGGITEKDTALSKEIDRISV